MAIGLSSKRSVSLSLGPTELMDPKMAFRPCPWDGVMAEVPELPGDCDRLRETGSCASTPTVQARGSGD